MSNRLTVSEITRILLTRDHSARPAVSLKLNSRGETQIEVTVPANDVEEAAHLAQQTYDRLCEAYRLESFANGNEPEGGTPFD